MNRTTHIETPFDEQIFKIESTSDKTSNELERAELIAILRNLRCLYVRSIKATIESNVMTEDMVKLFITHNSVKWYIVSFRDIHIAVSQVYFEYIKYINRVNRYLLKYALRVPDSWRIQYYRNKAIEHWDEYQAITTLSSIATPHLTSKGKRPKFSSIMVPNHGKPIWERQKKRKEIFEEAKKVFYKYSITLPDDLLSKTYSDFSEIIYSLLETASLHSDNRFPEELTKILFSLSFPIPVTDPEHYSKSLAKILSEIEI